MNRYCRQGCMPGHRFASPRGSNNQLAHWLSRDHCVRVVSNDCSVDAAAIGRILAGTAGPEHVTVTAGGTILAGTKAARHVTRSSLIRPE